MARMRPLPFRPERWGRGSRLSLPSRPSNASLRADTNIGKDTMAERFKVAIVTGAGTGVGKAICAGLLTAGHHVVMAGRRREALEAAAREIAVEGASTLVVPTDVTDSA